MYYVIVIGLLFVLPLTSIGIEAGAGAALTAALVGKWFVFFAVGWRLLLAGIRQIAQPGYTAREILGLKSDDALVVVRELGFANFALGLVGVLSLWIAGWQTAGALAGGVFYSLAGINHLRQSQRNRLENTAMLTDLAMGVLLVGFCACVAISAR